MGAIWIFLELHIVKLSNICSDDNWKKEKIYNLCGQFMCGRDPEKVVGF